MQCQSTASRLPCLVAVQSHLQSTSWHAHDYRQRPADRAPTPHLIRDILGVDESDASQPCRDTSSFRTSTSLVTSSSVGPDDDRHFGSRGHVDRRMSGPDWSTSGQHAGRTTSSAADTTLQGLIVTTYIYSLLCYL